VPGYWIGLFFHAEPCLIVMMGWWGQRAGRVGSQLCWSAVLIVVSGPPPSQLLLSVYNPNRLDVIISSGQGVFKHDHTPIGAVEFPNFVIKGGAITDVSGPRVYVRTSLAWWCVCLLLHTPSPVCVSGYTHTALCLPAKAGTRCASCPPHTLPPPH
jgi:hypothetical protein